ncbi:GDSL-type esterase/lipase family protein [Streptomyces sp. NPDC051561]|uniref:GDSL-type esterase/lipase family protein n=1 Tax=Streptomyces sp. NPDC051561 TaxID=3365658 RepID=UPI003799BAA2
MTWLDPGHFLRGVAWRDEDGQPVRADPGDLDRLPWDVLERAGVPVGVRLEFVAYGADAVELHYRAEPGDVPHAFGLWADGRQWAEVLADPADESVVRLELPPAQGPFTVYPPESQSPHFLGIRGLGGRIEPAPPRPRWLVHGDSITEGWWSTRPAHAWPAAAGRALGLDTVNLGHAGAGRGELAVAQHLARVPAEALTLAFGTNCWGCTPFTPPLLTETARAFLALVRQGHPRTPLLVLSPVLRPAAEQAPNPLGATLAELRDALEDVVRERIAAGDERLALLPGHGLLGPEHLADGLHPNDEGHAVLADAVATAMGELLSRREAGRPRAAGGDATHGLRRAG